MWNINVPARPTNNVIGFVLYKLCGTYIEVHMLYLEVLFVTPL
ncbi:hypothetical protein [Bacillus thuringiensis]|nr:hypothetical protein [Bacillus thuringiensis]